MHAWMDARKQGWRNQAIHELLIFMLNCHLLRSSISLCVRVSWRHMKVCSSSLFPLTAITLVIYLPQMTMSRLNCRITPHPHWTFADSFVLYTQILHFVVEVNFCMAEFRTQNFHHQHINNVVCSLAVYLTTISKDFSCILINYTVH
jgi:hypothetical protein